MKFQLFSNTDKHSRIKMGIVPILILVLAYVLFSPGNGKQLPVQPEERVAKPVASASQSQTVNATSTKKLLPTVSIAEITAHDPFQGLSVFRTEVKLPDKIITPTVPQDVAQQPEQVLDEIKASLKPRVVQGIISAGGKKAVFIDSQLYYEGDMLEEGVYIRQINSRDVVLGIRNVSRNSL